MLIILAESHLTLDRFMLHSGLNAAQGFLRDTVPPGTDRVGRSSGDQIPVGFRPAEKTDGYGIGPSLRPDIFIEISRGSERIDAAGGGLKPQDNYLIVIDSAGAAASFNRNFERPLSLISRVFSFSGKRSDNGSLSTVFRPSYFVAASRCVKAS